MLICTEITAPNSIIPFMKNISGKEDGQNSEI